ncbi:hypothetical protein [Vibrio sp. D431a]|uniref:hypothetical protein n=1 Tax=Vibrio sp. D431a TaxID=2837388 RepID=UPI00255652D1|nr:hypothetical protein [Vibrio sp. D431a]MDK9793779.1 hypothetical protein [Vibrio sp. D431a]
MKILNGTSLVNEINAEISHNIKERDLAVKSQWYEKAAKLEITNQGLASIKTKIDTGVFNVDTDTSTINHEELMNEIELTIYTNSKKRDSAIESNEFESAAKFELLNLGVNQVKQIINLGDHTI